ncbi:MAG: hypothetical protein ACYTHM_07115 [Planctomycetota bacterium]|jgi:hypothetical protein
MTMDRSYLNFEEGFATCCWNASSVDALKALFEKAGTPFEKMIAVEEMVAEAFVNA